MQRRDFLAFTLALPALAYWPLRGVGRPPGLAADTAANAADAPPAGFVVRAGQSRFGVPTPFKGIHPNDLKVSARDTGGGLALFDYVGLEPAGPSLHLHRAQDEVFYVVEGEFLFQLGEEKRLVGPGETVFLPRQVPHTWVQRSARGRLLYWVLPAGSLEEFFGWMSRQTARPTPAEMAAAYARHGLEGRGPGLSPTADYALSAAFAAGFGVAAGADRRGGYSAVALKVAGHDTGGAFSLFEYAGTGPGGPPLHVHPAQDEICYVLAGAYRFRVGAAEHELTAGDLIFLPRGVPHAFAQRSTTGRLLCSFQPTGGIEDFFRAVAALPGLPAPAAHARLFAAHGMRAVGPPLGL